MKISYNSKIARKILRLRKKYKNNEKMNALLTNIIWYSLPIVYTDMENRFIAAFYDVKNENRRYYAALKYARRLLQNQTFYPCLVTLTFTDKRLESNSEKYRRNEVSKFLNTNCVDYIACIDYGARYNREHYHAIALIEPWCIYPKTEHGKLRYHFREPWQMGFDLISFIDNPYDEKSMKYALKACRYGLKSRGKTFHKRKPYVSKFKHSCNYVSTTYENIYPKFNFSILEGF